MRIHWVAVAPLLAGSVAVHASPSASFGSSYTPLAAAIAKRDGHEHHNHNAAPLLVLNETEVTMYHAPTPPSYYTFDWEDQGYQQRHAGLMIAHGIFMCFAFFVSIPVGVFSSHIPS